MPAPYFSEDVKTYTVRKFKIYTLHHIAYRWGHQIKTDMIGQHLARIRVLRNLVENIVQIMYHSEHHLHASPL